MMTLIFELGLLGSVLIFLIPKTLKVPFILSLQFLVIATTSWWAFLAFQQGEINIPLGISSWGGALEMVIDRLTGFFILSINFICLMGFIYANGYLKPSMEKKRSVFISLHLFSLLWLQISMILVTSFQDGISFLIAWELMSLFSFMLVIFDGQKEAILKTGINYLLQMHFGFALIMLGFIITGQATGNFNFHGIQEFFEQNPMNAGLFFIFFVGFGIKAGFIPLHSWLPRAHPAAPSHVSGIMSGIMIKMGIYGILRISFLLVNQLEMIGIIILVISIISGILGVVMAIMQHDLKKLLAYHSIENIGIIGIGIALSIIGRAIGDNLLMAMGLMGALLHVLNHALFKSLLFFSTGNLHYIFHTVNMDHLGGISKGMRFTAITFLIGSLAISGLPPFNGFISEFFMYKGILDHLPISSFTTALLSVSGLISLVLIGGLCLYCFTKAFGLSFLGTRRSDIKGEEKEVPGIMILPQLLIISVILCIGFIPSFFGHTMLQIASQIYPDLSSVHTEDLFHSLNAMSYSNIFLIVLISGIYLLKYKVQSKKIITEGPTWGCGYTAGDYRHQYTPTSYADSLVSIVEPVVDFKKYFPGFQESEIFPPKTSFKTESKDLVEEKSILRWVNFIIKYLPKAGITQTGMINHYLLYPMLFLIIISLLTFLNLI